MPNIVKVTVENSEEILNVGAYGAGAVVRLQWSATSGGTYADVSGTGSTPTLAIVAGTEVYTGYDPVGAISTWYRTRYENAGATRVSDWSAPFQAGGLQGAYVSLATFRVYVRNQASGATDVDADVELLALEAAARAIDHECGRTFRLATGVASARVFTAGIDTLMDRRYAVDIDDVYDLTGMLVKFDASGNGSYTTSVTTYRAGPNNAPAAGMPYTRLRFDLGVTPPLHGHGVEVTANWGWSTVPANIANANLIQASRFLKRRDSPYGIAGSPDMGNELRLLSKLDPDVALLLRPYKLDWGYA